MFWKTYSEISRSIQPSLKGFQTHWRQGMHRFHYHLFVFGVGTALLWSGTVVQAQGTLVVPFGSNKQLEPAHETYRFPYKENYIMLPLTTGTVTSPDGSMTVIVNKPVTISNRRATVIPLGNGAPNVSPAPVVPQGFNGGAVAHPVASETSCERGTVIRRYEPGYSAYSSPSSSVDTPPTPPTPPTPSTPYAPYAAQSAESVPAAENPSETAVPQTYMPESAPSESSIVVPNTNTAPLPEPETPAESTPLPEPETPAESTPLPEPETPTESTPLPEPETPAESTPLPEPETPSAPDPYVPAAPTAPATNTVTTSTDSLAHGVESYADNPYDIPKISVPQVEQKSQTDESVSGSPMLLSRPDAQPAVRTSEQNGKQTVQSSKPAVETSPTEAENAENSGNSAAASTEKVWDSVEVQPRRRNNSRRVISGPTSRGSASSKPKTAPTPVPSSTPQVAPSEPEVLPSKLPAPSEEPRNNTPSEDDRKV